MKGNERNTQSISKTSRLTNSEFTRKTPLPKLPIVLSVFVLIGIITMAVLYFKGSRYQRDHWFADVGDKVCVSTICIGVIVDTSSNHKFPDGTIRDAVNI